MYIRPSFERGTGFSTSLVLIGNLLNGINKDNGGAPSLYISAVDVRDVAKLHLQALATPESKGDRFLIHTGENIPMIEVCETLKKTLIEEEGKNLPTKEANGPKGYYKPSSNKKAEKIFSWDTIPLEVTLTAAAKEILDEGI